MIEARLEQVSQGIYEHIPTEDVVGYVRRDSSILIWAIDGASTLTESPFTTFSNITDAGWFARQLSILLELRFKHVPFCTQRLGEGLLELANAYRQAGGNHQPLWAWPVTAATLVEIDFSVSPMQMISYHYADCFVAAWSGESVCESGNDMSALIPVYDRWKPYSGFEGEQLERLWRRREQQHRNQLSSALTLNADSAQNATVKQDVLYAPAHLLLGSDGLSRVWDTYQMMSLEEAQHLVMQKGLQALLDALRAFEARTRTGNTGLKRRDDACGIHVYFK